MKSSLYRRFLAYLRPYVWPHFTIGVLCMLVFSSTNGIMPFLVRYLFDELFTAHGAEVLRVLPPLVIVVFLLRGVMFFGSAYFSEYVGQRMVADIRSELNRHIQQLSLSFFHRNPSGRIVARVTSDVAMIRHALVDGAVSLLKDSVSLVVLIGVAFYQDWILSLIAFVVFPAAVLPVMKLSKRMRRFAHRAQVSVGALSALLQESIQGNRVVKAFGMEEYENRRFDAENEQIFRLAIRGTRLQAMTTPLMELLGAFGIIGVILYGGQSVIGGERSAGSFFAFLTSIFLLYEPFKRLTRTNAVIQQALGAAENIAQILDTPSDVVDRPGATVVDGFRDAIRFEGVGFRYTQDWVLRDIDLTVRRGEAVALVGRSGGGKSTLVDLLPRFHDVVEGRITLDGLDLRDLTMASLRAQMAIVTQHTFLFNDSVRNNIAYGRPDLPEAAIVAAAQAANADGFIDRLPQGYDTVIGEQGVTLSGGQRQRLAIARALLKDAPILILDEATSALDNESERLVQEALERLMRNRTTLVIAHRLSTVRQVDRIVVIAEGRIVEQGTHAELLALGGEYRRLHDLQFRDGGGPAGEGTPEAAG